MTSGQEAFLAGVARSDSYLGIVADRCGAVTPDGAGR